MRSVLVAIGMVGLLIVAAAGARADDYVLTIKEHRFTPAEIKVPANQRVVITVVNEDATPEEFETTCEPVSEPPPAVTAKSTVTPLIGLPLASVTSTDGGSPTAVPGAAVICVEEFAAMAAADGPGPEESPPQEACNTTRPARASGGITRKNFIVDNIRRGSSRSRRRQAKGQRYACEGYLWPGERQTFG